MSAVQIELIVLVVVLLLVNAAFSGSEMALVSLRPSQVDRLRDRGRAGRALGQLAEDPNEFLATIQIGITLAGFLASAIAATSFASDVAPLLGFFGESATFVAVVLVTVVLTFLTLVVGELAPKRIAMARAERWALLSALPLRWLAAVSRPAVWLLSRSTNAVVRLAGVNPGARSADITDEELRDTLLRRARKPFERAIFEGALEIGDRILRQIVVPRGDVTCVAANASNEEAIATLIDAGHTRAPLADDLDRVLGVVHLNDLVGKDGTARELVREALFLPETLDVLEALQRMQRERFQIAIVVDEYGGGAGIVTLEDVLEEIVGEIYDEFDPDQQEVVRSRDGSLMVSGRFPVHDLQDLDVDLPETGAATVAGLVVEHLGRLPRPGERVPIAEWVLVAERVDDRAVHTVRLVHTGASAAQGPSGE